MRYWTVFCILVLLPLCAWGRETPPGKQTQIQDGDPFTRSWSHFQHAFRIADMRFHDKGEDGLKFITCDMLSNVSQTAYTNALTFGNSFLMKQLTATSVGYATVNGVLGLMASSLPKGKPGGLQTFRASVLNPIFGYQGSCIFYETGVGTDAYMTRRVLLTARLSSLPKPKTVETMTVSLTQDVPSNSGKTALGPVVVTETAADSNTFESQDRALLVKLLRCTSIAKRWTFNNLTVEVTCPELDLEGECIDAVESDTGILEFRTDLVTSDYPGGRRPPDLKSDLITEDEPDPVDPVLRDGSVPGLTTGRRKRTFWPHDFTALDLLGFEQKFECQGLKMFVAYRSFKEQGEAREGIGFYAREYAQGYVQGTWADAIEKLPPDGETWSFTNADRSAMLFRSRNVCVNLTCQDGQAKAKGRAAIMILAKAIIGKVCSGRWLPAGDAEVASADAVARTRPQGLVLSETLSQAAEKAFADAIEQDLRQPGNTRTMSAGDMAKRVLEAMGLCLMVTPDEDAKFRRGEFNDAANGRKMRAQINALERSGMYLPTHAQSRADAFKAGELKGCALEVAVRLNEFFLQRSGRR